MCSKERGKGVCWLQIFISDCQSSAPMSDSAQQHCWSHPAFRGGAVVAAGSLLWVPFLTNEAFGRAMYLLTAPAVLFPIGALIGNWLGKQVKKLTWTQTL